MTKNTMKVGDIVFAPSVDKNLYPAVITELAEGSFDQQVVIPHLLTISKSPEGSVRGTFLTGGSLSTDHHAILPINPGIKVEVLCQRDSDHCKIDEWTAAEIFSVDVAARTVSVMKSGSLNRETVSLSNVRINRVLEAAEASQKKQFTERSDNLRIWLVICTLFTSASIPACPWYAAVSLAILAWYVPDCTIFLYRALSKRNRAAQIDLERRLRESESRVVQLEQELSFLHRLELKEKNNLEQSKQEPTSTS